MTLLVLSNARLLRLKFLFLNFLGEYSSKFGEGLFENWAFLKRDEAKKLYMVFLTLG